MSKIQAIEIACAHLGRDPAGPAAPVGAVLITRAELLSAPEGAKFKELRPAVWELTIREHRDFWSVEFDTPLAKGCRPGSFFVDVDNETGKVLVSHVP